MKLGLSLGIALCLSAITVCGQVTAPPPTLDRELEGKVGQALKPPAKIPLPEPAPTADAADAEGDPNVDFLFGVVVIKDRALLQLDGVPRGKPVQVPESDPILNTQEFKDIILAHCQKRMTPRLMASLMKEIIRYYHRHGHMLVDVLYQPQEVRNGMLQVTVLEAKLNRIKFQDPEGRPLTNSYNDPLLLKRSLRQREGQAVLATDVYGDLEWLNRNPFRKVQPYFAPGENIAESDLLLRVEERRPFDVSVGYENTGSRETGEDRISAGVTWGKAFGWQDHLFSYQFTASPDFEGLRAHVATYTVLLPWHHALRVFGTYIDVTGNLAPSERLEGRSYQGSLRYDIPMPILAQIRHELSLGVDFKGSDNNLIFGVSQLQNTPTEIFQAVLGYSAGLADSWGQTALAAQLVYSPGGVTGKNTDHYFNLSHGFAESHYLYGRFTAERETRLWRLMETASDEAAEYLRWNLRGLFQLSDGNLLASEQLGLGGYATVRGYAEREISLDEGWLISNELKTPDFNPAKWVGLSKLKDRLEFHCFWDYAVGGNKRLITTGSPEAAHIAMSSVGPGLRYSIGRNVSVRFDYGFPLRQTRIDPTRRDESRAHVGVNITY